MASKSRVLYIGVTNDLERRVWEHKTKMRPGFVRKYNVIRLVYSEEYERIDDAIGREKQLKTWVRRRKIELIEAQNSKWNNLSEGWFPEEILRVAQNDGMRRGIVS